MVCQSLLTTQSKKLTASNTQRWGEHPQHPPQGLSPRTGRGNTSVVETDNKGYCFYNHVYLQSVYCPVTLIVIHNIKAKQALCLHAVVNVRLRFVSFQHQYVQYHCRNAQQERHVEEYVEQRFE